MSSVTIPDSQADLATSDAQLHSEISDRLKSHFNKADELSVPYQTATPFPHIVIDNFLPTHLAERILNDFPDNSSHAWTKLPTEDQKGKWAASDESLFPHSIRSLIFELSSSLFLRFLEQLTDIPDLIADMKMAGGGLHQIEPGGKLSVHVDFSHHPTNGLNRRINLLLFLNKDWLESYGGHFELWHWSQSRKESVARILPVFNRCVMFSTSPTSWHGHPEPLACPNDRVRKSIALYYFSNGRPDHEAAEHNTLFKTRPGDGSTVGNSLVRFASSGLVRDFMPPVVHKALRRTWNHLFTVKK